MIVPRISFFSDNLKISKFTDINSDTTVRPGPVELEIDVFRMDVGYVPFIPARNV